MALTNNDILKKLRVALKLRDTEIVDILKLVDFHTTTSELGAFFRSDDHPKYMELKDQILRNFLNGLVIHQRGLREDGKKPVSELDKDSGDNVSLRESDQREKRGGNNSSSKPRNEEKRESRDFQRRANQRNENKEKGSRPGKPRARKF